jgi:hypothetical protein
MSNSITYQYTGSVQTFIVPSTITEIEVELYGAAGGGNIDDPDTNGGLGGKITASLTVTSGSTLNLYIGGMGTYTYDDDTVDTNYAGGWNGGGTGGLDNSSNISNYKNGAGGGGGTDIRTGTGMDTRIIVAGGGGGSGYAGSGGNGGGITGDDGSLSTINPQYGIPGGGGTDTSGGTVNGSSTPYRGSNPGELGIGGNATSSYAYGSGGGGGGYYGGGAGASTENNPYGWSAGGGGGSSWVSLSDLTYGSTVFYEQGWYNAFGNGSIKITYYYYGADISSISWSEINSIVSVEFNEAVYSNTSQTSDLSNLNFNLSISGGDATVQSTPTSTSKSNDTSFNLYITIAGTPNGSEILTINPSNTNNIYNSNDYVSSTPQNNNTIYLVNRILPYITSTNISGSNNLIVTFNEPVYPSSTSQASDLSSSNFTIGMTSGTSGGTISVASRPISCTANNNKTIFTLGLGFNTGISDGTEIITVNPSEIYDAYGNVSSITQSNNTSTLLDSTGPIITDVSMSTDNSKIYVTFNENVYNTDSGSGILEKDDFTILLTGGTATLSSIDTITTTNNISTFEITLLNTPDGSELITVVPSANNTIYDSMGNASSTSQTIKSVYLNDTMVPIITSISLASDNTSVDISINENVYNTNDSTGSLTVDSFVFSISDGVATLNPIPSSISVSSNVYTLGLNLNGTVPDGSEQVTVNPANTTSIYDKNGNAMSVSQLNNTITLNDQIAPYIKSIEISFTNAFVDVSFNETVYSTAAQTGTLTVNDFSLSITKGEATVVSTPTSISSSGVIYTLGYTLVGNTNGLELFKVSPVLNSIYDATGNVALVDQNNNTGFLYAPRISDVSLNSDNTYLTVDFNVDVFNTNSGSGNLENTDFKLEIFQGIAYFSSSYSTAISIDGSGSRYVLKLPDLIGIPNGQEILKVTPINNTSIYDSAGNPASYNQENNEINLTSKIIPYITNIRLEYDNSLIYVTFSEVVYNTSSGTGILEVSDFNLSITGGNATINSTPSSISSSDNITFTLNLDISGTPNGSELLTVRPSANSIYDNDGNVCTVSQSNNTVNLNEKMVPIITNTSINNDNSIITITFNEPVFNSFSGTGKLEVSDFKLSCSAIGVLNSTTPSTISQSGNVYSLGISLAILYPSGQEVITVQPHSNTSIYDSAGNAASITQNNNTISLRERTLPYITRVSINSDNSLLTVTFDDKVYSTDSGTGNLETNDFILSITNGYSILAYDYPYSITAQSDLSNYVLGIPLVDKCDGTEILTVNPRNNNSIYDSDGNRALDNQNNNTITLNHTIGPIITGVSISSDYQYVTVDFSENVYADVSHGTSIYQIDNYGSDVSSGIIYNTPENFSTILSKSITVTPIAYSTVTNLDRILISPDGGTTYVSIDDSFDISFNTLTDTYFNVLRSTLQLVEETELGDLSGYYRLDSELHGVYSLDIIEDKLVFNNAWDINRSTSIENSNYSGGYVVFDITFSSGVATLRPYARVKYSNSSLSIDQIYDGTGTSDTTNSIIYNTPSNFNSIMSQSISVTLSSYNSIASLDRIMISVDGGSTYLSINDLFEVTFTNDYSTYGTLLKSTFHLVEETDVTGYTGFYRLDSEMHSNYSLDIVNNQLIFSNAWDINRTSNSDGYVLFELDLTNGYLNPKYRLKYNSSILSSKIAFSLDSTYSSSNYLYYSNSSILLSTDRTIFVFKTSSLDLTIPLDFNPNTTQRVSNKLILFENISPEISSLVNSYLYGGTTSQLYSNTNSTYQPQIQNEGTDTTTALEAEIMLDNIISALDLNGETLRYDKEVYISFRNALLATKLKSSGIINGELDQNCVPYVYFTNETDENNIYHPFMLIATYAIADKPNRLLDVPRPPGEGGVDYANASVTRSTTLANFLIKIPMKNYGQITDIYDNDLTSTGTNNLRDDANSSDTYSEYNYASISSIGIAIDGVTIYPVLNNTLTPAQEAAEITNTGIHVGQGLQLHYHADGHSATENGLNLYNISDYLSQDHPPLIGFAYDGIALYGKYDSNFSDMDGYSTTSDNYVDLDMYGGHTHGNYGYHYHAHTVNSVTENLSTTNYTLHILLKGAWSGLINNIPDFWNTTNGQPKVTPSSNKSQYTGYKDYTGNSYTATPSTESSTIYLNYDSTNYKIINDISYNETSFNLYTTGLDLDISNNFNPLNTTRISNNRILLENITPSIERFSDSNFYDQSNSLLYSSTHTKYKSQIIYSGDNEYTETEAVNMLDTIQATLDNEGTSLRYEKNIYLAFRKAMLNITLKSHGVVNGVLNENTVPFVYFTNETDDDGIYHPFMVIASHGIPDKPNRLIDVTSPVAENSDIDAKIFRDAAISDYLFKIPLKDYGNITLLTDNDLTVNSGYNNLRDSVNSSSSYTEYNYSSISSVGIAIDGVPIYPVLNNTLTPVQEQAEISRTGIHTGKGMQLKYHADGHSASGNNLNLYNIDDYTGNYHPPLIGFSLDGIALYGKYESTFSDMSGYTIDLDSYGGHIHDDYGYHYHAHTVNYKTEDPTANSYDLHILLKGAWYGLINNIPEFWNSSGSPNFLLTDNTNQYVGNSSYSILNSSSSTIIASGNLDIYDFKFSLYNGTASLSSIIPNSISNSGFTYTLGISIVGIIDGNEKLTVYPNTNSIYDLSGNVALISNQSNNIIALTENIVPTIISSEINDDNTLISVTFSEEVYDNSYGSNPLETHNFSLSITGGTSTLTSNTPTSISSLDNTYYLGITLNGTPDGNEIITVLPLYYSIFDKNSNVLSVNQSNNVVSVNKKTLPEFSSVTINSENTYIIVNFNEEVYSTVNMTGNLTRDNFNLSLSGGSATLSSSTPLSIYRVNPYYLGINIIGTPNGSETLSVEPNGIYDYVGNLISSNQTNNNVNISEKVNPYITFTTISDDNSILTVTFNELVYNNSSTTEPLNINNFILYTNSNRSVLKSTNPLSVTQDGLSYLLTLNLGVTPKINDYVQVTLSPDTIYDTCGNLASNTQSNNIALFNTIILQDDQLITIRTSQSRIKKKKITGNSAKSKYSNTGVNTGAPVNN